MPAHGASTQSGASTLQHRSGYAASGWMGVLSGSISEAKPRSQLTTTNPRSSISSTIPRSPTQRPESSLGVATSSILEPTATPARMRAARSLAPLASMTGVSASLSAAFTLLRRVARKGDPVRTPKLRFAGEPLRTRRLRIGSPAYDGWRRTT